MICDNSGNQWLSHGTSTASAVLLMIWLRHRIARPDQLLLVSDPCDLGWLCQREVPEPRRNSRPTDVKETKYMELQHTSGRPWRVVNMQSSDGSDAVVWIVEGLIGRFVPGSPAAASSRLRPTAKSLALARDTDGPKSPLGVALDDARPANRDSQYSPVRT
jgi:hypothetical protein